MYYSNGAFLAVCLGIRRIKLYTFTAQYIPDMPEDVIQAKTASVINNLLNRRFLPNRYKIGIVRERNDMIPAERRMSFQRGSKPATHQYTEREEPVLNKEEIEVSIPEEVATAQSGVRDANSAFKEPQMSRQHDTPITESPSDSPKQTQMATKRSLPKKVEFDDLPDDIKHRAELSRRITIISQIQNEGRNKVSEFCGPGDEKIIAEYLKETPERLEEELQALRRQLYNGGSYRV